MGRAKGEIFGGGIPTAPDVKRLVDKFGIPQEKDIVKYGEIEAVLGMNRRSCRARTVINAWLSKLFREDNVVMVAIPNLGYEAADPSGRMEVSRRKVKSGFRHIKRGGNVAGSTDRRRLTEDEKRQQDKLANMHSVLLLAQKTEAKKLPSGEEKA